MEQPNKNQPKKPFTKTKGEGLSKQKKDTIGKPRKPFEK